MKKIISDFLRHGFFACGIGPLVLAVIYLIVHHTEGVDTLDVNQVCLGIFSLAGLAFIVGGMNVIYKIERLPLMPAIFIHGGVLYASYLITYLINDWLILGLIPIAVFSVIFVVGYVVIWFIIYSIIKRNTQKLNELLKKKLEKTDN